MQIKSKDDCAAYAMSQTTAFAAAGAGVGFLKAHFGYKVCTAPPCVPRQTPVLLLCDECSPHPQFQA